MLVLSRRIGEEIVIGDTTRVVILGIQGNRIRLGIAAPPEIAIQRKEIRERDDLHRQVAGLDLVDARQENRAALI